MSRGIYGLTQKVCPICNKLVFPPTNEWAYKQRKNNGTILYYCSWSCFRKAGGGFEGKPKRAKPRRG